MRKLLIALAMIPALANADALFEASNKSGGKMILTDMKCSSSAGLIAYSTMVNGSTLVGCWNADSQYVHILWSDNDFRSYPTTMWNYIGKTKPNT